jgi:hypothetical protein
MEIKGRITFLVGREETTIEVSDEESRTTFLKIKLTPEQLSSALSRLAYTECKNIVVTNLDRVGKKKETKEVILEISDRHRYSQNPTHWDELTQFVQSKLDDGWVADNYFGRKNSFFSKDDKNYVRCFVVRWV